jgi:CRP/FNR family transcriptional regulator, anaerobic regulatory protein
VKNLKAYFLNHGFSEPEAEKINSFFRLQQIKKNDCFVAEGKVSRQLAFLESGVLRYYSLTDKGEEKTTYISLPGTFVASLLSYLSGMPAMETIKAISAADIFVIEKNDVLQLQSELTAFKDFYTRMLEWQICCIDKSRFDLITLSAEQRYEKILKEEPELLKQVPLQYIASMIGVTPRHLSRLRGKI